MTSDIDRRDNLRNVVNHIAAALLQSGPDTFGNDLIQCMGMLAEAVDVDRVYIWKNHAIDGKLYSSQLYEWSGGAEPQQNSDLTVNVSYEDIAPGWEETLSRGDCICGFVREMNPEIKAQLSAQNILSLFVKPIFVHDRFWGFVGFDDCHTERIFPESEKSILESGCILLTNALLRNEQDVEIREAHNHAKVILDKTPFACHIWNKNFEIIDCNEENIRFFNVAGKEELMEHWADFSPEYQPDGQLSVEVARKCNQTAFDEGKCVLSEFIHMSSDGTPLPTEVTIVRIPYDDDFVIAVYLRDLREQKRMMYEIKNRDNLLSASNRSATALLSSANDEKFEDSVLESMGYIGSFLNVDRIYFWRNVMIDGDLCYKLMYEWLNNTGYQGTPVESNAVFSYSKYNPEWQEKFLRNECVNGPLSTLSESDRRVLTMYGMKSILVIPIFLRDVFWGFVSFEDCRDERRFSNDEIEILRSVGLMMANAFNRSLQAAEVREAHKRTELLLDAMPLSCCLINSNMNVFRCNEGTVRLFGLDSRQEFIDNFYDFSPQYQPDGQLSAESAEKNIQKAFDDGVCVFEWMHRKKDGTQLPTETTLVRIAYDDGYAVAGYVRDLREQKRMMSDIEKRDNLLNVINRVAMTLLSATDEKTFEQSLLQGMEFIGQHLEADCVQIWPNEVINDVLHFTLKHKWLSEDGLKAPPVAIGTSIPYNQRWKELFLRNECINGPVSTLPKDEDDLWTSLGITSTITIPLYYQEKFWGIFCVDDCVKSRYYSEGEVDILRSAGLMLVNAMNRHELILNIQYANEAKSSFLANMSHEMRTPLNAIIGLTDLSLGNEALDQESYISLEKINNAGMTLLSTVNDILDISKIESGKLVLVPAVYEIPSLLNDTVTQSIMHKGEKPIQFILDIDGSLPLQLNGDELRIKQIFNNLLSNAFKYTKEGTVELSISCARERDTIWMTAHIRDTGIGMQPDFLEIVFDNYTQMDTQANRKIMGTGLGLSITKMMIELMNGTISVESEYGVGSVFTVRLPQKYVSDSVIGPAMADSLKSFRYHEQKRGQASKLVRISLPYARVLIVDDVVTNLDIAKGLMKPYGMQIDCVTSGQEAVDAIRRETVRYDAIFMDHMMPGMDGVEATQIIRSIGTEYAKTIPIIALTANAIAGTDEMFLGKGFQAFLSKPIDLYLLDTVIRQWVRDKDREIPIAGNSSNEISEPEHGQERRVVSNRRGVLDRRQANTKPDGLDIDKGVERFGGDREAYFSILHSYMVHTRPLLDSIKNITENRLDEYAITVHGIKGSSRGIFAEAVGSAAEKLEKAAEEGDFAYVSAYNDAFLNAAWKLIFELEDLLSRINTGSAKPLKERPDKETLVKLFDACKSYNMDDVDDAIAELEKYHYSADDGLVSWLIDNIKQMNFKIIVEKLSGLPG